MGTLQAAGARLRVRHWWCAEEFLFDPVEDVQYLRSGALLHLLVASRLFPLGQEHPAEFVVAFGTLNRSIALEEHLVVIAKEMGHVEVHDSHLIARRRGPRQHIEVPAVESPLAVVRWHSEKFVGAERARATPS